MKHEYRDGTHAPHNGHNYPEIVEDFRSRDTMRRQHAREMLVAEGHAAVPVLIEALNDPDVRVRWEAAKSLHMIRDPRAIPALVKALRDDSFSVSWLAAEALVRLGSQSLAPVLQDLIRNGRSSASWSGVRHVLRAFCEGPYADLVRPVLAAMDSQLPGSVMPAAFDALRALMPEHTHRGTRHHGRVAS